MLGMTSLLDAVRSGVVLASDVGLGSNGPTPASSFSPAKDLLNHGGLYCNTRYAHKQVPDQNHAS